MINIYIQLRYKYICMQYWFAGYLVNTQTRLLNSRPRTLYLLVNQCAPSVNIGQTNSVLSLLAWYMYTEHDDKYQKVHGLLGICSSAVFLLVHVLHTVILLEYNLEWIKLCSDSHTHINYIIWQVMLLIPSASLASPQAQQLSRQITDYNHRMSGQPRPVSGHELVKPLLIIITVTS